MLLLALDTSTRYSSIALCSADELYGEYTWHSANNHSVELLTSTQRLLNDCHRTFQQVDAFAVATGPGSFNGVRVALATAKTLAFTLRKPLVGISSLDISAMQLHHAAGLVCAVQEAGRSEVYAASYLLEAPDATGDEPIAHLKQLGDYLLVTPQQLAAHLQEQDEHVRELLHLSAGQPLPPILFCGEIAPASRQSLLTHLSTQCLFVSSPATARRASTLALLAMQRLRANQGDDPLSLEPLYLRRPSITISARKQPLLGTGDRQSSGPQTTERGEGALRH